MVTLSESKNPMIVSIPGIPDREPPLTDESRCDARNCPNNWAVLLTKEWVKGEVQVPSALCLEHADAQLSRRKKDKKDNRDSD